MSVSIITPTFQSAEFIPMMLGSCVSSQGVPITNIVCDNLSTDGLIDTLFSTSVKNKIIWSSQPDNGPAQAINRGFELAETDIIGWINSDDYYAEGAIDRAWNLFQDNPELMVVYGLAQHINLFGDDLGIYPTLPPHTSIEKFRDGNFVCQPTIFFRKELLAQVGLLDTSLKTAFDFDWIIRIFRGIPANQIGFIDQIQAYSRLHNQCLTKKYREIVTRESVQVIARYFENVPIHWLKTYYQELSLTFPFAQNDRSLKDQILDFSQELKPFLTAQDYDDWKQALSVDLRLKAEKQGVHITMEPDGWVLGSAFIRLKKSAGSSKKLSLVCTGDWPMDAQLNFTVRSYDGIVQRLTISSQDDFIFEFDLPSSDVDYHATWVVACDQTFIPAIINKNSADIRKLSFKILDIQLN